jgi:hypothetical protein
MSITSALQAYEQMRGVQAHQTLGQQQDQRLHGLLGSAIHPWETHLRTIQITRIRRGRRWKILKEYVRKVACVAFFAFWLWGITGKPWL